MRWRRGTRSRNLEDRRAQTGGRTRTGRLRLPGGRGGGLSLGGIAVLVLAFLFLGEDGLRLVSGLQGAGGPGVQLPDVGGRAAEPFRASPDEEALVDFVSFVLDDLQGTWARLLPGYRDARLVLFRQQTQSPCGLGQAAMGPFYCPGDQKVYVDLSFYDELRGRFGAPGDFAQAYVLAHEIGHHIQKISGIESEVRALQQRRGDQKNALSVKMELQADCLAGVWGHHASRRGVLEAGDIEEGLRAAAAIGDDRIQRMSGRGVHPESFTHGSSAQRVEWLRRGLDSGEVGACDTFGVF